MQNLHFLLLSHFGDKGSLQVISSCTLNTYIRTIKQMNDFSMFLSSSRINCVFIILRAKLTQHNKVHICFEDQSYFFFMVILYRIRFIRTSFILSPA